MTPARDHYIVSRCDLRHRKHLRAADNLLKNERVMSGFRGSPNDPRSLLDGLVLGIHGFCKEDSGGKLHVCKKSLSKNRIPETGLAKIEYPSH